MPAKPLTPEQRSDAAQLRAKFTEWQDARRAAREPSSQEFAAAELGIGQSGLNQYLLGNIPLNMDMVVKIAKLLGITPANLAPNVVATETERAKSWLHTLVVPAPPPPRLQLVERIDVTQAHALSHPTSTVESNKTDWGDLMKELPQAFELVVMDESMSPLAVPGNVARFKTEREITPGKRVLVMDKDDVPYIREYRLIRGKHWKAVALNGAYEPLDSVIDGLRILAVMTGIDWE